jgi:hypothetical protein
MWWDISRFMLRFPWKILAAAAIFFAQVQYGPTEALSRLQSVGYSIHCSSGFPTVNTKDAVQCASRRQSG